MPCPRTWREYLDNSVRKNATGISRISGLRVLLMCTYHFLVHSIISSWKEEVKWNFDAFFPTRWSRFHTEVMVTFWNISLTRFDKTDKKNKGLCNPATVSRRRDGHYEIPPVLWTAPLRRCVRPTPYRHPPRREATKQKHSHTQVNGKSTGNCRRAFKIKPWKRISIRNDLCWYKPLQCYTLITKKI